MVDRKRWHESGAVWFAILVAATGVAMVAYGITHGDRELILEGSSTIFTAGALWRIRQARQPIE